MTEQGIIHFARGDALKCTIKKGIGGSVRYKCFLPYFKGDISAKTGLDIGTFRTVSIRSGDADIIMHKDISFKFLEPMICKKGGSILTCDRPLE